MKLSSLSQRMLVAVVFGILCLNLASEVEAKQERKPEHQERREKGRGDREQLSEDTGRAINWRELNLSQEQQEQLKSLRREFQIVTAGIRKELAFAEEDLRKEIRQEHLDREKIEQLVQDISSLKQRLSEAATENLLALKDILTPEQRAKLAASQQALPEELRALQLTDEQKMQIRELFKTSFRERRKLSSELRELKSDLRELLLSADEPDPAQLKELQAQIAAKELAQEQARVDNLLAIRDVLSPEQWKLLE